MRSGGLSDAALALLIAGLLGGAASAAAQPADGVPTAASAPASAASPPQPAASAEASPPPPPAEAPGLPPVPATTEQPRAFGHVLGDVLTQRVLLQHAGRPLQAVALPVADRIGLWLERRTPQVETDAEGRRWLRIDYQVINAPRALLAAALPALMIATDAGVALAVPAWPISLGPLTPEAVFAEGELQPLRPDRSVAPRATAPLQRQLQGALLALAAVLLAWAGWWVWRNAREAQHLPFARAWQELRPLARANAPLAAQPAAWLALHRALNDTAGRVVHGATLPRLLAEAPQLRPLQAELEAFYRQSAQRFFAETPDAAAYPLLELCRALKQVEQQHAR